MRKSYCETWLKEWTLVHLQCSSPWSRAVVPKADLEILHDLTLQWLYCVGFSATYRHPKIPHSTQVVSSKSSAYACSRGTAMLTDITVMHMKNLSAQVQLLTDHISYPSLDCKEAYRCNQQLSCCHIISSWGCCFLRIFKFTAFSSIETPETPFINLWEVKELPPNL